MVWTLFGKILHLQLDVKVLFQFFVTSCNRLITFINYTKNS